MLQVSLCDFVLIDGVFTPFFKSIRTPTTEGIEITEIALEVKQHNKIKKWSI